MRVLFVINSLGAGGTERSTAVLLPHLRARGIEPTVVCLMHRDEGDEASVVAQGFDVRFVAARDLRGRVREVRRLIRATDPAVVHTAIFEADVVGRLAAAGTGVPVLTSLVNTPYAAARRADPNVTRWKLALVRLIDALTARALNAHLHAVTPGVADDAVATLHVPRRRITVVERGRDPEALGRRGPDRRDSARRALGLQREEQFVLAVGRQEFQKGHVHLVEAMGTLARTHPHAIAGIAGRSGNASAAIDAAIARAGVADRVRLLGHRDDIADLLCAADVFVLPSLYEGTAGAAIEAMALEVPIVTSALDGMTGVVDDEVATIVPAGSSARLATAIADVLDHPDDAAERVARGRARFEARFTLATSAERMVTLYERVATMPGRPGRRARPGPACGPRLPELVPVAPVAPAGEPTVDLSVILCVRNGAGSMAGQLDALLDQEWDRPWEILVVDNGSTDDTRAVADAYAVRDHRVRVIDASGRRGLSHARNEGVRHARGTSVAFCDDDDRVGAGWVAAMGRALDRHDVVASRMEYEALSEPGALAGRADFQSRGLESLFGYPIVNGASGWRRSLWLRLGGNDEDLDYSGEDHDLALRAHLQAGVQPVFVPDAVYHCGRRRGVRPTFHQARRYGRAHVMLHARYGRGAGASGPSVLRQWAWLARHLGDLRDPDRSTLWAWRAGTRVGRLEGSLRLRTWYP